MDRKTKLKNSIIKENCRNASLHLAAGFDWSATKEGYAYWDKVHTKIIEITELA